MFFHHLDGRDQIIQADVGPFAAFIFQEIEKTGKHLHVTALILLLHNIFKDAHFGYHTLKKLLQRNANRLFEQVIDIAYEVPHLLLLVGVKKVCLFGWPHLAYVTADRSFRLIVSQGAKVFFKHGNACLGNFNRGMLKKS